MKARNDGEKSLNLTGRNIVKSLPPAFSESLRKEYKMELEELLKKLEEIRKELERIAKEIVRLTKK